MKEKRPRNVPVRRRWNAEKARLVLGDFERSGLSLAEFAEREGVKLQRLQLWVRRFRSEAPAESFREVTLKRASSSGMASFEVVLPSELVLRFGADIDLLSLRRVVAALIGSASC